MNTDAPGRRCRASGWRVSPPRALQGARARVRPFSARRSFSVLARLRGRGCAGWPWRPAEVPRPAAMGWSGVFGASAGFFSAKNTTAATTTSAASANRILFTVGMVAKRLPASASAASYRALSSPSPRALRRVAFVRRLFPGVGPSDQVAVLPSAAWRTPARRAARSGRRRRQPRLRARRACSPSSSPNAGRR